MTEKEVAELRRRFRTDKSNITHVKGCYVNEKREIISEFDQPLGLLGEEEGELLLTNLRKTLSGTLGKHLLDIEFDTRQVAEGEEHRLLMALRNSRLQDEAVLHGFYEKVIPTLSGNCLILLAYDTYDVPYRSRDGERQQDLSTDVFSYLLCCICPVKLTRAALRFLAHENRFHHMNPDWVVSPPELGFVFPAFDQRSTNLYAALCYTRDTDDDHAAFVEAVFHTQPPMPAARQQASFQTVLGEALAEDCGYEVVCAVHEGFRGMVESHKADKVEQPLKVSAGTVGELLESCGVAEERVEVFRECYDSAFGQDAQLPPRNLMDTKRLEIKTPDVTVQIHSERSDLVQTRYVDGVPCILIRAEERVEVNGVPIHIV